MQQTIEDLQVESSSSVCAPSKPRLYLPITPQYLKTFVIRDIDGNIINDSSINSRRRLPDTGNTQSQGTFSHEVAVFNSSHVTSSCANFNSINANSITDIYVTYVNEDSSNGRTK
eukprot:TRINITY_DN5431_c0_g1_i1.p1 TRINITY_DN5431_c0_g1~~TRINITY_DN5431_c0_g1_i1.p1  ORF type:complete len:130 (-),score=15.21 TRINITY_DN5431_c0_g1_i1:184-528(-)